MLASYSQNHDDKCMHLYVTHMHVRDGRAAPFAAADELMMNLSDCLMLIASRVHEQGL